MIQLRYVIVIRNPTDTRIRYASWLTGASAKHRQGTGDDDLDDEAGRAR